MKYYDRMNKIIDRRGVILVKRADGYYLGAGVTWAADYGGLVWTDRRNALRFSSLRVARGCAKLHGCKVVVVYPKRGAARLCPQSHRCPQSRAAASKVGRAE